MNFGRVLSETLKALRDSEVPAIVVGGVAIAAHGVVRGTQDLDLAIASVDAEAAVAALEGLVDRPTVLHYLDRYELAEYRRALGLDV